MSDLHVIDMVPMVHVASVERSIAYYRKLGFEVKNTVGPEKALNWAWMDHKRARIMLSRADGPIDPKVQAVLFYHYTNDLVALRQMLLDSGERVSEITYPFYMPEGEICTSDPDGYTLLIGQAELR